MVESVLNVFDLEQLARERLAEESWLYFSAGTGAELTLRENRFAFQRVWLRPRVLVDVSQVDTECTLLGTPCALPLFISAFALSHLAHGGAEVAIARAAGSRRVVQMIPTLHSRPLDEIASARVAGQAQWFQLYVNSERSATLELLRRAESVKCSCVFVTVDRAVIGRREKDTRSKMQRSARGDGLVVAKTHPSFVVPQFDWNEIAFLRSQCNMKMILKGVQDASDAVRAHALGFDGVLISNHGGRQLDASRPSLEVLQETIQALGQFDRDKFCVLIDGGIRRGSDVYKALALGAHAVGIGRPVVYGLAAFGQAGVERAIDVLREELVATMKSMGTPRIGDITAQRVDARSLQHRLGTVPQDMLHAQTYEPLRPAKL
jgi:L-lactate dehydrogenase (cytochrome)